MVCTAVLLLSLAPGAAWGCAGDCDGDGMVTVDEIVRGVGIALGTIAIDNCTPADVDGSGSVSVDEIIAAVNAALTGCPRPSPSSSPTLTLPASPSLTPPPATDTVTPPPATNTATPGATPSGGALTFTDVTAAAGLSYVQYRVPDPPLISEMPFYTGGAAAGDYDGDGWVDLYVTRFDAPGILFRNTGDGHFEDVTAQAGLDHGPLGSNGAAWGDIDNDGDLDLYVTTLGDDQHRYYLFINDGHGRFTEEAIERGAAIEGPSGHYGFSVTFGDYDRDGWLDIHTCEWHPDSDPNRPPSNARLLHNRGAQAPGFFDDVTQAAGVAIDGVMPTDPKAFGTFPFSSRFSDLDNDGWPDLLIAADFGTSRLFWNNHDGTFTDGTAMAGVGQEENGMGSAVGDYNGDGLLDWFVTSIFDPLHTCSGAASCHWGTTGNRLYRNEGGRVFSDQTDAAGVRDGGWGWGTAFFDYDNDGDLDIVMTNGVEYPFLDLLGLPNLVAAFNHDPMRLWRNDDGVMTELATTVGITDTRSGKGLLTFDYDNDGDLDVFVVNNSGSPVLYRNDGGNRSSWLRVKVVGRQSNRDAIGARVSVVASEGGREQVREVDAGSHFLGQSELTAHFGLGAGDAPIAMVRIDWPASGQQLVLRQVARNTTVVAVEPTGPASGP